MALQQTGASEGTEQLGTPQAPKMQAQAAQPAKPPRSPGYAAFGNGSGAAIMFRDYASI